MLAQIPWPTEAERVEDQVRRDMRLSSEERFRAQLTLLSLVEPGSKAMAPAKRWHDRQDAMERQHFRELFERHERKRCSSRAASRRAAQSRRGS